MTVTRMSNRELAQWLAWGYGQKRNSITGQVRMFHNYFPEDDFCEVSEDIMVREWDSDEWVIPSYELYKKCVEGERTT